MALVTLFRFRVVRSCALFVLALAAFGSARVEAAAAARLIFLGDSITEGYGVSKSSAFPSLVEAALKAKGYKTLQVVNAGISGSTSASALGRLKWLLKGPQQPTLLVIALGANDGLRGLSPSEMQQHLTDSVRYAKEHGVTTIVLAGMQMPTNYGKDYRAAFAAVFPTVAKAESVPLMPFLLAGVAADPKLNQADGIHPNEAGHQVLAQSMLAFLTPLLGPP